MFAHAHVGSVACAQEWPCVPVPPVTRDGGKRENHPSWYYMPLSGNSLPKRGFEGT